MFRATCNWLGSLGHFPLFGEFWNRLFGEGIREICLFSGGEKCVKINEKDGVIIAINFIVIWETLG